MVTGSCTESAGTIAWRLPSQTVPGVPMAQHHETALELNAGGDWDAAHRLIQAHGDPLACQVHGYLHRIEGDLGNAAYWYRRAGAPMPDNTLEDEHARLVELARD